MRTKQIIQTVSFLGTLLVLGLCLLILPPKAVSGSERRPLTQYQSYGDKKAEAEKRGQDYGFADYFSFMEQYMLDQFPMRDGFRTVKSLFRRYALCQRDNNGYYYADGSLGFMEESDEAALAESVRRLNGVYDRYFARTGAKVYYAVIPDKGYYLARENGYPSLDYEGLYDTVESGLREQMTEIDLCDTLSALSYYKTDPHWEQSKLLPVADRLLTAMGRPALASERQWTVHGLSPYYGTYYGHAALPVKGETMNYMTAPHLEGVTVTNLATGEREPIYALEKFHGDDPYDVFLGGGVVALLRIDNPNAAEDKQLVLFRDSFGSSILPLLISEYREIIVVDIRYASPSALSSYVRFRYDADVLFLYSATVLNTYGAFLD